DAVDDHEPAGVARDVDALPQRERPHEGGRLVRGEAAHECGQLVLALAQHRGVELCPEQLGGLLGGPAGGEQAERSPTGGPDQLDELTAGLLARAVPSGRRQVARDVEDALASVVEGRADVHAVPAPALAGALWRTSGRRPSVVVGVEVVEEGEAEGPGDRLEGAAERERGG